MSLADYFIAWDRLVRRTLHAVEALHAGVWLGCLRENALTAITAAAYAGRQQYRDAGHNRRGLFDWECVALDRYFGNARTILNAGCGGGREMLGLIQRGHDVCGFDPDASYVATAMDLLAPYPEARARVLHAAPSRVPPDLQRHDGAVLGWGVYTHIVGRAGRIAFLREFASVLNAGAPILVSFWERDESTVRKFRAMHAASRFVAALSRNPRPMELGDLLAGVFAHCFVEEEIRAELDEAGYEVLAYSEHPYAHAVARLKPV